LGRFSISRSGCPDTDVRTSRFGPLSQSLGPLGRRGPLLGGRIRLTPLQDADFQPFLGEPVRRHRAAKTGTDDYRVEVGIARALGSYYLLTSCASSLEMAFTRLNPTINGWPSVEGSDLGATHNLGDRTEKGLAANEWLNRSLEVLCSCSSARVCLFTTSLATVRSISHSCPYIWCGVDTAALKAPAQVRRRPD
jgi:hypothetical protein